MSRTIGNQLAPEPVIGCRGGLPRRGTVGAFDPGGRDGEQGIRAVWRAGESQAGWGDDPGPRLTFRSGWLRQCRGARMGVIVLEAWRQPPSNVFKGEGMMDRFLAWFGLARRGEVTRLEGEMETLTQTLVGKEGVIERLEGELLFRRRFFDDTALMNHDLKDIHSRLDGMLA